MIGTKQKIGRDGLFDTGSISRYNGREYLWSRALPSHVSSQKQA